MSESLQNTNNDLLACIGFVGLMTFSTLEALSGLGQIDLKALDVRSEDITRHGPTFYTLLLLVTCLLQLIVSIRLRVAVGRFSLALDPTDRPFRPFRLTDSYLGYLLLAFLFTLSVHLYVVVLRSPTESELPLVLAFDAVVLVITILAEPISLHMAHRHYRKLEKPLANSQPTSKPA
jgi:hypothetical protein